MTSPSSGVRPIVVSTDTPSRIAAALQPLPRWAVTRRNPPGGRPSRTAARSLTKRWLVPWNPYRRTPYRVYHSSGTAYRKALAGMVWWNAVSNTATCGSPGRAARIASMPARLAGLCSGARWLTEPIAATTSSSTSTERVNRSPPCTTRWPTPIRRA